MSLTSTKIYICKICNCTFISSTNLNVHYKSKKHLDKRDKLDNQTSGTTLSSLIQEIDNVLKNFDSNPNIKTRKINDYGNLKNNLLKSFVYPNTFLPKTLDDKYYQCTGCNKNFVTKSSYKHHSNSCSQIEFKYKSLSEITIELAIKLKETLDTCNLNFIAEKNKTLENENNELIAKLNKIQKKNKELKNNLREIKTKFDKIKQENIELNAINKTIKELHKNMTILNSNNNSNNTNNTINIIFKDSPTFEFINPFIDKTTGMPYDYDYPKERSILRDNVDAEINIKASLCNAIAFHDYFTKDELVNYVSDCIIKTYKKTNPSEQTIWTTDVSRNSYRIHLFDEETKQACWHKDKNGVILEERLMKPIIRYILSVMCYLEYYHIQKHLANQENLEYPCSQDMARIYRRFMSGDNLDLDDEIVVKFTKLFCSIDDLRICIKNQKFCKEVMNKIASKFYFDSEKTLLDYNNINK